MNKKLIKSIIGISTNLSLITIPFISISCKNEKIVGDIIYSDGEQKDLGIVYYSPGDSAADVWSFGTIYTMTPGFDLSNAIWIFDVKNLDEHTVNWREYLALEIASNGQEDSLKSRLCYIKVSSTRRCVLHFYI